MTPEPLDYITDQVTTCHRTEDGRSLGDFSLTWGSIFYKVHHHFLAHAPCSGQCFWPVSHQYSPRVPLFTPRWAAFVLGPITLFSISMGASNRAVTTLQHRAGIKLSMAIIRRDNHGCVLGLNVTSSTSCSTQYFKFTTAF